MNRRSDAKHLALEVFVVLVGVLLALLVDGVRERAQQRSAAGAAVNRVLDETRQNLAELRDMVGDASGRLAELHAIRDDPPPPSGLSDLIVRFHGFRTPDLGEAAWQRLSGSDLADYVDPAFLAEAFHVYQGDRQYQGLEDQVERLVYSEAFYHPDHRDVAIRISERIMEQEISWAEQLIPLHEALLERFDGTQGN